jgi:hypothetical protein
VHFLAKFSEFVFDNTRNSRYEVKYSLFYFEWRGKMNAVDCENKGKSRGWWQNIKESARKKRAGKTVLLQHRWDK